MTHDPKLDDSRVLAHLAGQQPLTAHQVAEQLSMTLQAARAALRRLMATGRIATVGDRPKKGVPARYAAVNGQPIKARQQAAWRGVDWSVSTMRPGCLDHERHGSLQPDGSVRPYAPPQYYATSSVAQVRER